MTDYLTELLRPEEDALERAIRRAENALAGGRLGETEREEWSPTEGTTETAVFPREGGGRSLVLPRESTQEERNAALRGGTEDGFAPEFARPEAQPLAGALQKADRSAAQADVLTRGAAASQSTGDRTAKNRAWTAMGRAEPGQTAAGGELETAQRVDRPSAGTAAAMTADFFSIKTTSGKGAITGCCPPCDTKITSGPTTPGCTPSITGRSWWPTRFPMGFTACRIWAGQPDYGG